jgi:hypothetical protein
MSGQLGEIPVSETSNQSPPSVRRDDRSTGGSPPPDSVKEEAPRTSGERERELRELIEGIEPGSFISAHNSNKEPSLESKTISSTNSSSGASSDSDDEESSEPSDNESTTYSEERSEISSPQRNIIAPLGQDGANLSFTVELRADGLNLSETKDELDDPTWTWPQQKLTTSDSEWEAISVMAAKTTLNNGQMGIQLIYPSGPNRKSQNTEGEDFRWLCETLLNLLRTTLT